MKDHRMRLPLLITTLAAAATLGCRTAPTGGANTDHVNACVSILPLAYFVERVGGEHVQVQVLVGPGQSPHVFEPSPQQMTWLSRADAFFTVGLPFERQLLDKLHGQRPDLRTVDTTEGLTFLYGGHACEHDHAGEHEHGHSADERDPHVWLDPQRAKTMAANICRALSELAPAHKSAFEQNLARFQGELDSADARLQARLAPYRGREFLVFHPAYTYFADRYGLKQLAVEVEGKEPTPRQLVELIEQVKAAGVRAVLIEPQYSPASAAALAREIRGEVLVIDDLARDYLTNLNDIADKITRALGDPPKQGE
jgi:zinc transport system substrate-binding protein